jgi:hypothetical protein
MSARALVSSSNEPVLKRNVIESRRAPFMSAISCRIWAMSKSSLGALSA